MKQRREIYAIFATYFCIHAFNGLTSPFLPLFLEDMGFDVTARGLLLSIGPVIAVLTQPMWGSIGDRARDKSTTLRIMAAGMILVTLLYLCSASSTVRAALSSMSNSAFSLLFILPALLLYFFFQSPMQPMADTVTMEYIYQHKPWFSYGIARVTGTIAFAILSYVGGLLIERSSMGTAAMFPLQMAIALLMTFSMFLLPRMPGHREKKDKTPATELLRDPWFLMILIMALTTASTMGFYTAHFSTYLRGSLMANEKIVGISSSVSALLEIGLFFITHKIIKKTGILNLMLLDLGLVALRWLIFSLSTNIAVILLVQFFTQPFSWAIFSYALTVFVQRAIEGRMHARAQAILNGIALSLGRFIGTLGGSGLIALFGETRQQQVFLTISVLCLAVLAAALVVFTRLGWRPGKAPERFALNDEDAM
ncbi:MAG: MFS transporter [Lachnospiraceae bacterium]|nr:MFS transporter [Lachnospiraceae bacterium]